MTRIRAEEPRCSNGTRCVAYPALGEPSKLSRSNPGTRCFACEERRIASELRSSAVNKMSGGSTKVRQLHWGQRDEREEHFGREHTEAERVRDVLERRRRSVLTCERGLRSALASGDERLVRRWSKSLRDARDRLVWAEADVARAEKRVWAEHAS